MKRFLIAFGISLALAFVGTGIWFYITFAGRSEGRLPAQEALAAYLQAIQSGDTRAVFDQTTRLGPELFRMVSQGRVMGADSGEAVIEKAFLEWERKFLQPVGNASAAFAFERQLLPREATFLATEAPDYRAEVRKFIGGLEQIQTIERKAVGVEDQLIAVKIIYPSASSAPVCAILPNCAGKPGSRIKSVIVLVMASGSSTDPGYYRRWSWFENNQKTFGGIPGWNSIKSVALSTEKWSFEIFPEADARKVEFFN